MTPAAEGVLAAARTLADEMLFADAMRVDRLDVLPVAHLDALGAAGLYGAPAPREVGGLGLDLPGLSAVVEEIAGGCLATAFVWIQHFRLLMALAAGGAPAALRDQWLEPACQGTLRGGIALAGMIPGPPLLSARPFGDGWRLDGTAPWVTGWGLIDLVVVVARGPQDSLVTVIMDAVGQPGLTVSRQRLSAVDASVTVRLGFDGVVIPEERFAGREPFDPAASVQPAGLRINGSLALGVARRCCRLLGPGPLDDEVARCRESLDAALQAGAAAMAEARAAASELALRATAALAVRHGSSSITVDTHPQRLAREAVFLLVFGSRPGIKSALLHQLGAAVSLGGVTAPAQPGGPRRPGGADRQVTRWRDGWPASMMDGMHVEEIYIGSSDALGPVSSVRAVAGQGLEGDRYYFPGGAGSGEALTLVEAEALEDVGLTGAQSRRQVVVRGVRVNELVGKRFRVGDVECLGVELCEPCLHLQQLTRPGIIKDLLHRGGLRADILSGGTISVGDKVLEDLSPERA